MRTLILGWILFETIRIGLADATPVPKVTGTNPMQLMTGQSATQVEPEQQSQSPAQSASQSSSQSEEQQPVETSSPAHPSTPMALEPPPILPSFEAMNLNSVENLKTIRDPFHPPDLIVKAITPSSELERYATNEYTIVAVITGPKKLRALLNAPSGKNYMVSEKDKIGLRSGVVKKITTQWIQVQEKIVNALGEEEAATVYIRFKQDAAQAKAASGG